MSMSIESDRFADSLEDILGRVGKGVVQAMPGAVRRGVRKGASEWRKNAKRQFKDGETYRKHGKTYTVGNYRRSIRSHLLNKNGDHPLGEVGSPKMPGLPHLLEEGHAKVGGGRVPGREHIAPAADAAFEETYRAAIEAIDGVLNDK